MTETSAVDAAMAVTGAFLDTFNALDARGHAETLAYPHVRLASGQVRIWQDLDEAAAAMELGMAALRDRVGWDHSRWNHRRLVHDLGDKVHLDVEFTRYRGDGSVIGVYPAVYVVVRAGDRWGIQCRSSAAP